MIGMLWRDLWRIFRRDSGLALTATALIALGVGLNGIVFCVLDAVVLRPLPYREADRLCVIQQIGRERGDYTPVSLPEFVYLRDHATGFEDLVALTMASGHLTGHGDSGSVKEIITSANYFSLLGVQAQLGRTFAHTEDKTGFNRVAVISAGLWRTMFGGNPNIIGRSLELEGISYMIIGVARPGFHDPNYYPGADVWLPITVDAPPAQQGPGTKNLILLGRIGSGLTAEQCRSQLAAAARAWLSVNSQPKADVVAETVGLDEVIGVHRSEVILLFITTVLVLLIATANVTNLLLVRFNSRRKEFAIRQALGAGRLRVILHVLKETVMLSVVGSVGAVLVTILGVPVAVALCPRNFPRVEATAFDVRALVYIAIVAMMTGVVAGLVAAVRLPGPGAGSALGLLLKEPLGGTSSVFRGNRAGRFLVAFEIAITLMLSVGAGLVLRTFLALRPVDTGFDPEGKLVVMLRMPKDKYRTPGELDALYWSLVDRLRLIPAVKSVAADTAPPMSGIVMPSHVTLLGESTQHDIGTRIFARRVSDNYFQVMGVKLVAGRVFAKSDTPQASPVVVVNRALAEAMSGGTDPCGMEIMLREIDPARELRVIGVVADERIFATVNERTPQAYLLYVQYPDRLVSLIVQTRGSTTMPAGAIQKELISEYKDIDFYPVKSMEQSLEESVAYPRFLAVLMTFLAGLALAVASMGVYATMSYATAKATREIGIRRALGANPREIVQMVLGEALLLTVYGIGWGLLAAVLLAHSVGSLVYGVKPTDPLTFILALLVLSAVAASASYVPARRAASVDPATALRYE